MNTNNEKNGTSKGNNLTSVTIEYSGRDITLSCLDISVLSMFLYHCSSAFRTEGRKDSKSGFTACAKRDFIASDVCAIAADELNSTFD